MPDDDSAPKLSPVEGIKATSRFLRGSLAEELAATADHFSADSMQLLKFHGSYQQEDRDARKARSKAGVGKAYMFMIRLKLPGGKLLPAQYLAMDDIAGKHANGTLRLTTRQSIQFHGVLKSNLKATIADINAALVTSLGACGDVNRNVVCCPAPGGDPARVQMQKLSDDLAAHLAPKSGSTAYHEIWLNGEKVVAAAGNHPPYPPSEGGGEIPALLSPALSKEGQGGGALPASSEAEPIYGDVYLPRKFKIAFSLPHDNCTDILAQCLGFLAVVEEGQPVGYNMYVGGGQGMTNSKPDTYPVLAQPVCFVTPDQVVAAAEAVVKLYRDHGNRGDRKRARIKYLMHDWGVEKFRSVFFADYFHQPNVPVRDLPITGLDLHLGWHPQRDGKAYFGLSVENGRIKDDGAFRLRSALKAIVAKFQPVIRISCQQDILLGDIAVEQKGAVEAMLVEHGVPLPETLPMVRKWSMACPAIPTCGLALSESERALPGIVAQLGTTLANLGLGGEAISIRMTGCPNGCARPYQSEVGIVGRSGDKYTLYIGGDSYGRRLNFELMDMVPRDKLVTTLATLFGRYKTDRGIGEDFGGYCHRLGAEGLKSLLASGN